MKNPNQWPMELEFSMKQRILFALGAWFLLFLPGIVVALIVALILSFARSTGLHL